MRPAHLLLSLTLHALAIGAVVVVHVKADDDAPSNVKEEDIVFELVDAAAPESEASFVLDEPMPVEPEIPDPLHEPDEGLASEEPVRAEASTAQTEMAEPVQRLAETERAVVRSEPMALNRITPIYPRRARRRGAEGVVMVEATVDAAGIVSDVTVSASSGSRDLDASAVHAVRSATFAPATENGVGVCGRVRLTFEFRLH